MIRLDLNKEEAKALFKIIRRPSLATDYNANIRRVRERLAINLEEDPDEPKYAPASMVTPLPGQTTLEEVCDFDTGDDDEW